jgi:DNA-binding GntR family transcriptional regulator
LGDPSFPKFDRPTFQHNDDSVINRVYAQIREKLISFELRPGERLREQELADEVSSSRLSVREVLSRLVAEKIVVWEADRGFSVRSLRTDETFQLFELRRILESHLVALAIERSTAQEREEFDATWKAAFRDLKKIDSSMHIRQDEAFHERIAGMARNAVLKRELDTIASRIHFVRGIDLRQSTLDWADEHNAICRAVLAADGQAASTAMESHLSRLFEDVQAALKIGVSQLYIQ